MQFFKGTSLKSKIKYYFRLKRHKKAGVLCGEKGGKTGPFINERKHQKCKL